MPVTRICFTPASEDYRRTGLLGVVDIDIRDEIRIRQVAVRRTQSGRHVLRFPTKKSRRGRMHPIVDPLTASLREEIERAVFKQIGPELENL